MPCVNVAAASSERDHQVRHVSRRHMVKKVRDHRRANRRAVERIARPAKSIRLRLRAKIARRPVDFFAIFVAGVASIVIIVNAVFLQSGLRPGIHDPGGLTSKVQPQEFLKSEGERLQRKAGSALAGIKIVETRPGARRGR
jgi:hypothetical protein